MSSSPQAEQIVYEDAIENDFSNQAKRCTIIVYTKRSFSCCCCCCCLFICQKLLCRIYIYVWTHPGRHSMKTGFNLCASGTCRIRYLWTSRKFSFNISLKIRMCSKTLAVLIYFSSICLWIHLISHSHSCRRYYQIHEENNVDVFYLGLTFQWWHTHTHWSISFYCDIILLIFLSDHKNNGFRANIS